MRGLVLRAPEEADVPALTALMNLPGVRAGTARLPFTDAGWVRSRVVDRPAGVHSVVGVLADVAIAWGSLTVGEGRRRHSAGLGLSVHDEHWGRGIGRTVLAALLELADGWLGLARVELDVLADNPRAIALYEGSGFEREGLARRAYIAPGGPTDAVLMARLRPAPGDTA